MDWQKLFTAKRVLWGRIAKAAPETGLVCCDESDCLQLHKWNVATNELTQITFVNGGITNGFISPDGRYAYYLKSKDGNETGHFHKVDLDSLEQFDLTPELPAYTSFLYPWIKNFSQSADGATLGFCCTSEGRSAVIVYDIASDTYRSIYTSDKFIEGPILSPNGKILIISNQVNHSNNKSLLLIDVSSGELIHELTDVAIDYNVGYFTSNHCFAFTYEQAGYERPALWDIESLQQSTMNINDIVGELQVVDADIEANKLLLQNSHHAQVALYIYHMADHSYQAFHCQEGVFGGYYGANLLADNTIITSYQDIKTPAKLIKLDHKNMSELLNLNGASLDIGDSKWQSVSIKGAMGEQVQAWLAVPEKGKRHSTILHTHGGPTAVMYPNYMAQLAAMLQQGYAVISINYHGSTGFGKNFEKSIDGRIGELELEDLKCTHTWLIENEIADPDKIFLYGGSYGGYLTLLGLTRAPTLWAGGIAMIAVFDWLASYEHANILKNYIEKLFAATDEDELLAKFKAASPMTYARNLNVPLLLVHGKNDPRCPAKPMYEFIDKCEQAGQEVASFIYDTGHGALDIKTNIEIQKHIHAYLQELV